MAREQTLLTKSFPQLIKSTEEISRQENELEEARGLTDQVMAFWNKQRRRATAATQSEDSQSTKPNKLRRDHEPTTVSSLSTTPTEANQTRPYRRRSSQGRSVDKARPSPDTQTPTVRTRTTSMRQPLRDLDLGLEQRFDPTSSGSKPYKSTQKSPRNIMNGYDENAAPEVSEGSFCDSDYFASADQRLVADVHSRGLQAVSDDATMEF